MLRIASIALAATLVAAATPAFAQASRASMYTQQSSAAAATQATISTLSATGNSSAPYQYTRQDISWTLQNASKGWTATEASALQVALDKLPIGYLRRARTGGMTHFNRDAGVAHVGFIPAPGAAGVSPPFLGYVSLGDGAFPTYNNSSVIYQPAIDSIACHELGHQIEWGQGAVWMVKGSAFTPISWDPVAKIPWYGLRSMNLFATEYSMTNPWEDFADACRLYWYQPDDLKRFSMAKWQYMHDRVFDGLESTGDIRQYVMQIRPFVTPQINGLSAYSADPFTIKTIHGNNWLSMWDGGYTHVGFGNHGAVTSMCVSRQTIYAMVPDYTGYQPVHVSTPDGGSNWVGFNVNKPWYQFW